MTHYLFVLQRLTALIMAPLVLVHLGLIVYAVRDGLTAAEILARTQGHWGWMGSDDIIKSKAQSCIETQHRDTDQMLASFRLLDGSAINHKTATHLVDPQYPPQVQQVLSKYPYWSHVN